MKGAQLIVASGLFYVFFNVLLLQPPCASGGWPKAAILMCEKYAKNSPYGSVMTGECNIWLKRVGKNVCLKDPEEELAVMMEYCVPYVFPEKGKLKILANCHTKANDVS